jgi:rhamnosyltransferase
MNETAARVAAVIVSFHPERATFARLIAAIRPQVAHVLVVDNGTDGERSAVLRAVESDVSEIVRLGENRGLGCAHNVGQRRAWELGASHVLLLDQDSAPSADMVERLLATEGELLARGVRVGAVGPVYYDPKLARTWPFYAFGKLGVRERRCGDAQRERAEVVPCDLLITSGALIRRAVLERTGPLREDFFIEHVDTEWSLRARYLGFLLFGACSARMEHSLGDSVVHLPITGQRVQLYPAYRYYYAFRNALLLWRLPWAVWPWKLNELKRLALRVLVLGFFGTDQLERLGMMVLGIRHGLQGRSGKLKPD